MAKKVKKAYGYVRVSGQGQVEGDGFPRQEQAIQDYAALHGMTIERIFYEEGVTGTLANRPALGDMFVSLEENGHGISTILVEDVNRLARDLMIQETIIHDMQRKGFKLVSVHGGDLLSDDPTRVLVRQVLGSISQYDKTMTVLKLRAARERKRARGERCEGRKGYDIVGQDVIREIKRLRRKRPGRVRRSYKAIVDIMNATGMTTVTGRPFNGQIVANILHRAKK